MIFGGALLDAPTTLRVHQACSQARRWALWTKTPPFHPTPSNSRLCAAPTAATYKSLMPLQANHTNVRQNASMRCLACSGTPGRTLCPLRILTGTMSGLVMRSVYTRPWNTCAVPSSLLLANSG
jgi:hypothetical protein